MTNRKLPTTGYSMPVCYLNPQLDELEAGSGSINPAQLTRQILTHQDRLMAMAKDKTLAMTVTNEGERQAHTVRQQTGIKIKAR